jgi:hypothetical protein
MVAKYPIEDFRNELRTDATAQDHFQVAVTGVLNDIGEQLQSQGALQHYEVGCIAATQFDAGEVCASYISRRGDRSVFVWVGQSALSEREDELICTLQLRGRSTDFRPECRHRQRLGKPCRASINAGSIRSKVETLLVRENSSLFIVRNNIN